MNKVIDTSTRLFLAIVGPSGSGKTELIFKFLKEKTFYPKFQRALYFYKEIQPHYSEKSNTHSIDLNFIKFNGFDSLRNHENILLVFDDSCEEIYNDKDFDRNKKDHRIFFCVWYNVLNFSVAENFTTISYGFNQS